MESSGQNLTVDDFEVIEEINKGCFGKVSKIKRKETGEILVWKEIIYKDIDKKQIQLIVSEVNIMKSVKDENIVRYYHRIINKEKGRLYIVMEYCQNGDLKAIIDKHKKSHEPVEEKLIWNILTQMALALKAWHYNDKMIIHRDIKPGNIFIDKYNNLKLGDFGLSKQLSENSYWARTNVGTPYYMSPEQVSGNEYTEKWDIWSLGCILHELACLKVPFQADNYLRLAEVIKNSVKPVIPDRYSSKLSQIIDLMMNKDPEKRPTAKQLLEHPIIIKCLLELNLKTRTLLSRHKSEQMNKERELNTKIEELKHKEESLREKSREVERLKQKYEIKLMQLQEKWNNLTSRQTRNNMPEYNTDVTRTYKDKHDFTNLNKTTEQYQDMSAMYSSQDKQVETSIKYHNRYMDMNRHYDNKENVNVSNSNLMSSSSSLNRNNFTSISGTDSKNMSGSNNFDDSQNDLSKSKTKMQKQYREYPSKKININLYSEGNSSGSLDVNTSRGNICTNSNEKMNQVFQSIVTGTTRATMASKVNNALSKHLANKSKERSFDNYNNQVNTSNSNGLGLPPSGQNLVHKSITIDKHNRDDIIKSSQEKPLSSIKRNFSTNNIGRMAQNEESSRNRLCNRKSIPTNFRGEEIESYQRPDHTFQIMSSRQRKEDVSNSSHNNSSFNNTQLYLKKAESENVSKPPMQDTSKGLKLKTFFQKNPTLARTLSRGKLGTNEPPSQKTQQMQYITTRNQEILNNKTIANIFNENRIMNDTVTPKNQIISQLSQANRNWARRASINNLKGAKQSLMHHNNGSVTNRTHVNPLQEESIPIQNHKIMFRNPSGIGLKKAPSNGTQIVVGSSHNFKTGKTLQNWRSKPGLTLDVKNQARMHNFWENK